MGKKDYSRMYNKPAEKIKEEVEEVVIEETPFVEKEVVIEETPFVEKEVKLKLGNVICAKLNVRKHPSIEAEIEAEIIKSTEVSIDESQSTDKFYKICTSAGIEGYCMKQFIELK